MRAKVILNLLLILAVAALVLYAIQRPTEKSDAGARLSQLKREQVARIAIERRDGSATRLEKRGEGWYIVAPLTTRADSGQVDRVLDVLSATARQKLPHEDLARFELDPPQLKVTLDDQAFAFGRINDVTNEQYVATADAVYLVAPFYGYGVPTDAIKLASRKLLADDEIPVAFDFGRYRIARDDKGHWAIEGASPAKKDGALSQNDFNLWADEWQVTYALAVEPYQDGGSQRHLTLRFKNGKSATFRVISKESGFALVRNDQNMLYRFGAEVGRRLMDPHVVAAK